MGHNLIIWKVKDIEGHWITNEDMFWLALPEPLVEVHVMGYPIQKADFYFFMFNAAASFGPGKITGITFGGFNNGNVTEYRSTDDGVKGRRYPVEQFPYARDILKKGEVL